LTTDSCRGENLCSTGNISELRQVRGKGRKTLFFRGKTSAANSFAEKGRLCRLGREESV